MHELFMMMLRLFYLDPVLVLHRRARHHFTIHVEPRTMTGAVPGLFGIVPVDAAAHMVAGGADAKQSSIFIFIQR